MKPLSEALQSAALSSAANSIVITDRKGRIVWVNPAFTALTGYKPEEVLGKTPRVLRSKRHDEAFYENLWTTILAGKIWSGEVTNQRKDGSEYTEEMTITPVRTRGGKITHFIAIKQNISEQKRLREQLFGAQRLEAIARLAGGLAHDFNNTLMVVIGYSDLLLKQLNLDEASAAKVISMRQVATNSAQLTRQLLAFSRTQVLQPRVLDLNELVINTEKLLHRLIGEDIKLIVSAKAPYPNIKADPSQMDQILMNLVVNSRDAMPQGGRLEIETATVELDETYCRQHQSVKPGCYVMLAVTDSGVGMDSHTVSLIFEPFFTTKAKGKGTGLGLSTVYGIVKQSGGYIWVYSEPDKGTTFKIYFPRISDAALPMSLEKRPPIQRGTETILVVEDEDAVRDVLRELLASNGYHIICAKDGPSALEIAQSLKRPPDLLITDWVMPNMTGGKLVEKLASQFPNLKTLYISGFAQEGRGRTLFLKPGTDFLQKPFLRDDLLRKVRAVLDAGEISKASQS